MQLAAVSSTASVCKYLYQRGGTMDENIAIMQQLTN